MSKENKVFTILEVVLLIIVAVLTAVFSFVFGYNNYYLIIGLTSFLFLFVIIKFFSCLFFNRNIKFESVMLSSKQSKSILFDINVEEGNIFCNKHFKQKFGYELNGHLFDEVFKKAIVHEEDIDKFMSLPVCNKHYNQLKIRMRNISGNYIWCKVKVITLFNESNMPLRLIGKIIDIDKTLKIRLKQLNPSVIKAYK